MGRNEVGRSNNIGESVVFGAIEEFDPEWSVEILSADPLQQASTPTRPKHAVLNIAITTSRFRLVAHPRIRS